MPSPIPLAIGLIPKKDDLPEAGRRCPPAIEAAYNCYCYYWTSPLIVESIESKRATLTGIPLEPAGGR